MKLVKYFLQKKSVTLLLLVLILAGGLFSYIKMGKLEDAPFTIKQALVLTPYPGASPSEVYNPQIEMFARFKMKSSFHKTKRII